MWQLAEQFGATCSEDLTRRTTHVIAARKGTSKVNSAQRRRDVSIVTLSWLLTSVNLWRRQPESAYILDGGSPQPSEVASSLNDELDAAQKSLAEAPDHMPDEAEDLHDIDWGDAEAEIEAFLNETDEEDSRIEILHEDTADEHTSEDEASYSPTDGKKRSLPDSSASTSSVAVGSPLAKRRRVAAARVGRSKLKLSQKAVGTEGDEEVDDDAEDEELDDFARALEGELM